MWLSARGYRIFRHPRIFKGVPGELLVLALDRRCFWRRQRFWRFSWLRRRGGRSWRSGGGGCRFGGFGVSLFPVYGAIGGVRSDRSAGARLLVLGRHFDLFEVAGDVSFARACLDLHWGIGRDRNLYIALAVIALNIAWLTQPDFDRAVLVFQTQIARQTFQ